MELLFLGRWCSIGHCMCVPGVLYAAITIKCAYHFRDVVSRMLCGVDPIGVLLRSRGRMVRRRYGLKVCKGFCYLGCIWRLSSEILIGS